jgi:hypothetical protein
VNVKRSTLVAGGAVALVAAAAVVSGVKGLVDRHAGSAGPMAARAATTPAAPAATLPVGDVRRLPKLRPGELQGALLVYVGPRCRPAIVDLAGLRATIDNTMVSACTVEVSPDGTMLAFGPPGGGTGSVFTARAIVGPTFDSGLQVLPFTPSLVTVADDGAVAVCDGSSVLLARGLRVRPVRTFTSAGLDDERCVTGAIGRSVVRLSGDRRRLVDVATGRTVRRLAEPVRRPVLAIAASADGYVLIADAADKTHRATVYGPAGDVAIARQLIGPGGETSKVVLAKGGVAVALLTPDGWTITSLADGRTLRAPGNALVTDVAFSPDATAVAATTPNGIVFADVPELTPRSFLELPAVAVAWFEARLLPVHPARGTLPVDALVPFPG